MAGSSAEPAAALAACDVRVAGGGINGVGIPRDLAGRGLHVVLRGRDDLSAHTSSVSSQRIHSSLRDLEHVAFCLMR